MEERSSAAEEPLERPSSPARPPSPAERSSTPRPSAPEAADGAKPAKRRPAVEIRAVLFDFDGTLTLPGHLDFGAIRSAIGCPPGESLLAFIDTLEDAEARRRAQGILDDFETRAAERVREDPDAAAVVHGCLDRGLRLAIITRNSRKSVERSIAHFSGFSMQTFDTIVTRDDPVDVKPKADGVHLACSRLGVAPAETILVGDFVDDIVAGERAGTVTVFYDSDPARSFDRPASDHTIARLGELLFVLSLYRPLPAGKVPNALLASFLSGGGGAATALRELSREALAELEANRRAVLAGPGVGEDVAAISTERLFVAPGTRAEAEVLLVKSDPITFLSEETAQSLLTVNANDIATAGGTPRWLLATLLLPPGTLPIEIAHRFAELGEACARAGVVLCGGHTELTDAVSRPVVSGTMIGTVSDRRLIRKTAMQTGDRILLTKGVAVEGTAILARERREELRKGGVAAETIERAARLCEAMSIRTEAEIAAAEPGVAAMHDVTEGGVATALRELSTAGGHRIRVDVDRIPVLVESEEICSFFRIDPLGLIGSGSLLVCVRLSAADSLVGRLRAARVTATVIGEVLGSGDGLEARKGGLPFTIPEFATDELARLAAGGYRAGRGTQPEGAR